ncbi:hypothetical protein [Actinomadura geliboluensis]|uniref:hypothetical protein n=1 Tax=Actinomadura geliboluensis TaxID=882440 RepID=UPI00197AC8CD|nr:hypothetical protein [Actinomadura geliboluensis]
MPEDWSSSVDLHLAVDAAGGRRAGLERALRAAIAAGRLAPGGALPSTRALGWSHAVPRRCRRTG